MMKILITLILLAVNFSMVAIDENNTFTFKGEIEGYGNGMIQISFSDPTKIVKDSIEIIDDKFKYEGSLESPKMTFMKIMKNDNLKENFRIDFFMENSPVTLKANVDDLNGYSIRGSKSNEEYQKLVKAMNPVNQAYIKARKAAAAHESGSGEKVESTRKDYLTFLVNYDNFQSSHVMAYILWLSSKHVPLDLIKQIVPRFDPSISNNVYLKYLVNKIEGEDSVEPGEMAKDFQLKDLKGNEYSLTDFKGNYILIEFSASWCVWCKKEYPYLKRAYQAYSDKGLQILTFNLDDQRAKWAKDVEKEKLPWLVLSDLNAFSGELTKNYSVRAIPRIFLINPEGVIVANSLRGEKILDKLQNVYE